MDVKALKAKINPHGSMHDRVNALESIVVELLGIIAGDDWGAKKPTPHGSPDFTPKPNAPQT